MILEHGWQSWSPTTTYRLADRPHRAVDRVRHVMGYRPELPAPAGSFQGEGLLAVQPGSPRAVHVFGAADGRVSVPSIRATVDGGRLVVTADGEVEHRIDAGAGGIDGALARWADRFAAAMDAPPVRPAPTTWCSWYHYYTAVREADIVENLEAIERLDLPVDVVQIDDGYQAEIGDWLTLGDRFRSLPELVGRIRDGGREAGIWLSPFLVGARSAVARDHPDWLLRPSSGDPPDAGYGWDQPILALDASHPRAAAWLDEVFATLRGWGFSFFKLDFLYAGAMPGRRHADGTPVAAYRTAMARIRQALGDAYVLGCGAPILPSVGLVDAMRVSPDTGAHHEPESGDPSQAGTRSAIVTGRARAFQQGRFWANDPDCLIVRPAVERREAWADHVDRWGGLRGSSDRIADLDEWGTARTREILGRRPAGPFVPS